jgi:hypothetical protein
MHKLRLYNAFAIALALCPLLITAQTKNTITIRKNTSPIVGVWEASTIDDSTNTRVATLEFTSSHIFNELKGRFDGDKELHPDENGTWEYTNDTLTITVTGEANSENVQQLYPKPQISMFAVSFNGSDLILRSISEILTEDRKNKVVTLILRKQ